MFKRLLATLITLLATTAFAAGVDANKATQAELEAVKGIGPAMAGKILDERKKGSFKDWNDMVERVKGIGEANAAKFSAEGLTVGGAGYKGAAAPAKDAKPAAAKEAKPAAAAAPAKDAKPAAADKPAAPAAAAPAKDAKPAADDKKAKADDKKPAADKPAAAASGAKK